MACKCQKQTPEQKAAAQLEAQRLAEDRRKARAEYQARRQQQRQAKAG